MARLELLKRGHQLERNLPFLADVSKSLEGVRVNLPNKSKGQSQELLDSAGKILSIQPAADICVHYSFKNMPHGVAPLQDFLRSAVELGVRRVLLVSGTGKRPKEDTIWHLEQLAETSDLENLPCLGVAFSPFEEDRGRLRRKLKSGPVPNSTTEQANLCSVITCFSPWIPNLDMGLVNLSCSKHPLHAVCSNGC